MNNHDFTASLAFRFASPNAKAAWVAIESLARYAPDGGPILTNVRRRLGRVLEIAGITLEQFEEATDDGLLVWEGNDLKINGFSGTRFAAATFEGELAPTDMGTTPSAAAQRGPTGRRTYTLSEAALAARRKGAASRRAKARSQDHHQQLIPSIVGNQIGILNGNQNPAHFGSESGDLGVPAVDFASRDCVSNSNSNNIDTSKTTTPTSFNPSLSGIKMEAPKDDPKPKAVLNGVVCGWDHEKAVKAYNTENFEGLLKAFGVVLTHRGNDLLPEWQAATSGLTLRKIWSILLWRATIKANAVHYPNNKGFRQARQEWDDLSADEREVIYAKLHFSFGFPMSENERSRIMKYARDDQKPRPLHEPVSASIQSA